MLEERIDHNKGFSEFSKTQDEKILKLKKKVQVVCNPFSSYTSTAAEDTYLYSKSTSRVIVNKTGPFLSGFHWFKYVFCFFKVTVKMAT